MDGMPQVRAGAPPWREPAVARGAHSGCLPGAVETLASLMADTDSDTASLARFDEGDLVIEAIVGTSLLGTGARLPISSSTSFLSAMEGRLLGTSDFGSLEGFDRPLDRVTTAAGFRGGCVVPLTLGTAHVGAVSLASRRAGWDYAAAIRRVGEVAHRLVIEMCHADTRVSSQLLIGHDDPLAAEGLARLGEMELGVRATLTTSIHELVDRVAAPSDLLVTDCFVAGERIEEQMRAIAMAPVSPRVLVVASHDTAANRAAAARAGVAGYCARGAGRAAIAEAFLLAASGHQTSPVISDEPCPPRQPLTARERQVLVLLERGLQVKQIAGLLRIAPSTAKGYVRNIFSKLDVHSATAALYVARDDGMLDSARAELSNLLLDEPGPG